MTDPSASSLLQFVRVEHATMLVRVSGEIDLNSSPDLRGRLLQLLAEHKPSRVVLNLDSVPYMDSSAIAVLVEMLQKLKPQKGSVVLTHVQPRVHSLLRIARLDQIFRLESDDDAAMRPAGT